MLMKLKILIFVFFLSQLLHEGSCNEDNLHLSFLQDARKANGAPEIQLNEDPKYNIDNDEVDPNHPESAKFSIHKRGDNAEEDSHAMYQMSKAMLQHVKNGHVATETSGN